jgi:hypothetical protein
MMEHSKFRIFLLPFTFRGGRHCLSGQAPFCPQIRSLRPSRNQPRNNHRSGWRRDHTGSYLDWTHGYRRPRVKKTRPNTTFNDIFKVFSASVILHISKILNHFDLKLVFLLLYITLNANAPTQQNTKGTEKARTHNLLYTIYLVNQRRPLV